MSVIIEQGKGYSAARPTDAYLLYTRRDKIDGRVILIAPPANNTAASFYSAFHNSNLGGWWPNQLAQDGCTVMVIDAASTSTSNAWANDAAMGGLDDALAFLAARGYPTSSIGLFGWSMGGLTALNYLKRHTSLVKCVCLLAPSTNLDYARTNIDTAGVDAAYGGNYPAAAAGHDPILEPASFRSVAPVHIYHALNDSLIPIQQSRDFVAAVNDHGVVLTELDTGAQAGHFAVGTRVPTVDVLAMYRQYLNAPTIEAR